MAPSTCLHSSYNLTGLWSPTYEGVMILFALGILVDSMLTIAFLLKILYLDPAKIGLDIRRGPF